MDKYQLTREHEEHPLMDVFIAALDQAMYGKGERHGGHRTHFMDQPMWHYLRMHGRAFATGQAAKKLEEAASLHTGDKFINEALGAIVYAASAVLYEMRRATIEQPEFDFSEVARNLMTKPVRRSLDDVTPEEWSEASRRAYDKKNG